MCTIPYKMVNLKNQKEYNNIEVIIYIKYVKYT